jgi:hypothetical protein
VLELVVGEGAPLMQRCEPLKTFEPVVLIIADRLDRSLPAGGSEALRPALA